MKMIRNGDLDKTLTIEQVQKVLEEAFPTTGGTWVDSNPEGFGAHYVENKDILDTEYVMQKMVEEADRGN